MSKTVHSHEWWLPYLRECKENHFKISEYCKKKGFRFDAFYWHWRKEYGGSQKNETSTELVPIVIAPAPVNDVKVEINGIDVNGNVETIRRILGIES